MHSSLPSLFSSCRFSSVSEQPIECFEPFQKLKAGMARRKSILFPHSNLLLIVPRWYFCCGSLLLGFGVGFADVSPYECNDCFSSV